MSRTIYIDSEHKCHVANDGTMLAVEVEYFDGKCDAFIEGYCYEIRDNGCVAVYPWKTYEELDVLQREYERQKLADAENALAILLGGVV